MTTHSGATPPLKPRSPILARDENISGQLACTPQRPCLLVVVTAGSQSIVANPLHLNIDLAQSVTLSVGGTISGGAGVVFVRTIFAGAPDRRVSGRFAPAHHCAALLGALAMAPEAFAETPANASHCEAAGSFRSHA